MGSVMNPDRREFKVGGKTLIFRPLFYGDFSRFLGTLPKAIEEIGKAHPDLDLDQLEKHPGQVFMMVGDRLMDEILEWIALSLMDGEKQAEKEWLAENLGMADCSEIIALFVEENDIKRVIANFKRLGSVFQKVDSAPKPSSLQT